MAAHDRPGTDGARDHGGGSMSGIPAERYGARLAAARVEAQAAGLDVLCIGVGADLRYLTGYEALPLERLTMLLVPAADGVPLTLIAPRLEATPARTCAAAAAGAVEVVTWEETEDPMALVASRLSEGLGTRRVGSPCGRRQRLAARGVRAGAAARAPQRLVHRRVDRPAPAPDAQGRRRGRAPAAGGAGRGPGRARDRERQARRAHRGGCRARGPRAAARRGSRGRPSSRSSPRVRTAPRPTTTRASG